MVQRGSRDSGTNRSVCSDGGGAGGIWENTIVNVTHSTELCFQNNFFAFGERLAEITSGITDIGCKEFRLFLTPGKQCRVGHGLLMIAACQLQIFCIQHRLQTGTYRLLIQMEKISQTECFLSVFITVGIGDSAAGRTEGGTGLGKTIFFQFILNPMPWHGNGSQAGQFQMFRCDRDSFFADLLDFPGKMFKIDDHAAA